MKYFSFAEFEASATAAKYGIDNTIPDNIKPNITALIDNILDPLREAWGSPINVTSGYRCPELNNHPAINGSRTSQHMAGQAVDIVVYARDASGRLVRDNNGCVMIDKLGNRRLFQLIQGLNLPFDQLIDESNYSWVHVSHRADGKNRKSIKKL